MNNDQKRQGRILRLIIVILAISVVIVIALIGLLSQNANENEEDVSEVIEEQGEDFAETYSKSESGDISKSAYFDITACIKQYLSAINTQNDTYYTYDEDGDYVLAVEEDIIKEAVYDLLGKNYITQNNITIQNVYDKIQTLDVSTLFVPLEISRIQDDTIKSFIVYGLIESQEDYQVIDEIYIIVNIDATNNTYSIDPIDGEYNSIQEIKINQVETVIEENDNNTFTSSYATNEESVKDYINLYKRLALGNPEKAYELLDEEYRTAKFGSLEAFKEYVEENRETITGITATKYQVTEDDEYTQYVCIDQNGHYYIFWEKSVLDYTVILDTYTIDLPEFIEVYEQASNEEKVLRNIQRFFDAINDGDYEYAYNKLDATYKANNFSTLADFEDYVKTNFFSQNSLAAGSAAQQGDVYIYDITISDASEEDDRTVTTSFAMQLKEGTDFVMSFGVE